MHLFFSFQLKNEMREPPYHVVLFCFRLHVRFFVIKANSWYNTKPRIFSIHLKIQVYQLSKETNNSLQSIGHFTVVYLVAKPLIWSEAEGDHDVMETII